MTDKSRHLCSMTGFARASGHWRDIAWQWEIKSVNGKALDLRFRLPPGTDQLEAGARTLAMNKVKRGNLQVNLVLQGSRAAESVKLNEALLNQLVELAGELRKRLDAPPVQAESLLGMRGVMEIAEDVLTEEEMAERDGLLLASFASALEGLVATRREEGKRLAQVIDGQLRRIAELASAARENPSRRPDSIRQRLAEQVARLMEQSSSFDEARLHQEAILLATRADIQEELDRLDSHIEAAHALMASGEPVGRKFDFLAQEFNREANTLCSKASDRSLTAIGLDLKTVIDQLREQVQNIE